MRIVRKQFSSKHLLLLVFVLCFAFCMRSPIDILFSWSKKNLKEENSRITILVTAA